MLPTILQDYNELLIKCRQSTILQSAMEILNWDMETKMPPKGVKLRSEQLAELTGIVHRLVTDPDIGQRLDRIDSQSATQSLSQVQKRNIYLLRKSYEEKSSLSRELVVETERQRAITINIWKKAKATKNYNLFRPELEKLTTLTKQAAEILKDVKQTSTLYDALIDIYEPKVTSSMITQIFDQMRKGLITLIEKCVTAKKQPDITFLSRPVPIPTQILIANALAETIKYDIKSEKAGGRIDETEHPFTTGYYDDVRITTHYYQNDFSSSVFSVLHEGGHALYEQNLPAEWMFQPIGSSCSLGFHESQSRFVENIIGRSREFWDYFYPIFRQLTKQTFFDISLDQFVFAINHVKPSKIRVAADEVTYGLHIIIRFEIERELMQDRITVSELPLVWNQKYRDYLDLEIEHDSEGVMQDTHWAGGTIGYFPTYALGNIYSGQILGALESKLPQWRSQIQRGNNNQVKEWLINQIFSHGSMYDPIEFMKKVTGKAITVTPYLEYLNAKYSQLYDF
jgi:carboxypeptidase Taq